MTRIKELKEYLSTLGYTNPAYLTVLLTEGGPPKDGGVGSGNWIRHKTAWEGDTLNPEKLTGWQKITDSDTEAQKKEKHYNNMNLFSKEWKTTLEKEFDLEESLPIGRGILVCKTADEFGKLYSEEKKHIFGVYSKGNFIAINETALSDSKYNFYNTPVHELLHAVGKEGYGGWGEDPEKAKFMEEGLTELLARKICAGRVEGVKPEDMLEGCYQDIVTPMLFQLMLKYPDKDEIFDILKNARVSGVSLNDTGSERYGKILDGRSKLETAIEDTDIKNMDKGNTDYYLKELRKSPKISEGIKEAIDKLFKGEEDVRIMLSEEETEKSVALYRTKKLPETFIQNFVERRKKEREEFNTREHAGISPLLEKEMLKWFLEK